jgi:hypothetical protein
VVERLSHVSEDIWIVASMALATCLWAGLEVRLEEFEPKVDIDTLDIPTLAEQIDFPGSMFCKILQRQSCSVKFPRRTE